jgi:hypothetical protein
MRYAKLENRDLLSRIRVLKACWFTGGEWMGRCRKLYSRDDRKTLHNGADT